MIAFLKGTLVEKEPTRILVDVAGVGYEVAIPLSSYDRLPAPGETVHVTTHFYVREDSQQLFGFSSSDERELFLLLLGVSGIGPKIALSALSGLSLPELKAAIVEGAHRRLASIKGIGKKMAERIVIELRDRISAGEAMEAFNQAGQPDHRLRDATNALVALGYKQLESHKMIKQILKEQPDVDSTEDLIKAALGRS